MLKLRRVLLNHARLMNDLNENVTTTAAGMEGGASQYS